MAIAWRSNAGGVASSGSITPALPSGWVAGDIFISWAFAKDNVSMTWPVGWTEVAAGVTDASPARQLKVVWRRAEAGDVAPLVTHTAGSKIIAEVSAFSGCIESGTPTDGVSSYGSYDSGVILDAGSVTTTTNNTLIVFIAGGCAQFSFFNLSYTASGVTFTERVDVNATSGPTTALATGPLASAGATGAISSEPTTDHAGGLAFAFALKEATGGGGGGTTNKMGMVI